MPTVRVVAQAAEGTKSVSVPLLLALTNADLLQLLRKCKGDFWTNWNDYLHLASNHSPKCCGA